MYVRLALMTIIIKKNAKTAHSFAQLASAMQRIVQLVAVTELRLSAVVQTVSMKISHQKIVSDVLHYVSLATCKAV